RPAVEAGLMLAQTSELSLALGLTGMMAGHIGPDVFTVIALDTVGTMLLTPVLTTDRVPGASPTGSPNGSRWRTIHPGTTSSSWARGPRAPPSWRT
ncbi:MAG: hypothetical protein P8Y02_13405, partial [Deinococcales bacterium]